MPVRRTRRSQRFVLGYILALLLASGLAVCSGSADDAPPPVAPETAVPNEPAAPVPPAETPRPSTTPEAPVPKPLPDPVAPAASPPPAEPASSASEPAAMPGEPSPPTAESPAPEPAPLAFRYDTYDRSGAVTEPGHYAFLADGADPASVVTTYEELRDGTATALLIHTHDAHGASQAAHYDAVATGDLVEWKQAADCFVRYTVTSAPAPPADAVTRAFGVAWMTYAFTGCSGAIPAGTGAGLGLGDLPNLGGPSLTVPIRHALWQIVPQGMTSVAEEPVTLDHAVLAPSYTEDLATARQLPRWRDPALPAGWILLDARVDPTVTPFGYQAFFGPPDGIGVGLTVQGEYAADRGYFEWASWRPNGDDLGVTETRLIAGRPAMVRYGGPNPGQYFPTSVRIYDAATESEYTLFGKARSLRGPNVEALIAIARSLFEPPNAP